MPDTKRNERPRCQALNLLGKQCRKRAVKQLNYHGDSEIYYGNSNGPSWVCIWVCATCRPATSAAVVEWGEKAAER